MFRRLLPSSPRPRVFALLAVLLGLVVPASANAWTITRTSASAVSIDSGLNGTYAQYRIGNDSGASQPDIWVRATNFSGSIVGLAANENGLFHVGAMANATSSTVAFLLNATGATATSQTHAIQVWDGKPGAGGVQLATQSFGITVTSEIAANSNKVDLIEVSTSTPALGGLTANCEATGTTVARCEVTVYATVHGRRVAVGTATSTTGATRVRVRLTALGRSLASRPGGIRLSVVATVHGADGQVRTARAGARVQGRAFMVPRPVFFATASSTPNAREQAYLHRLGARLKGARELRCVGFTDSRNDADSNARLGLARAKRVCDELSRSLGVPSHASASVSRGEDGARATNRTARGRQLNRRTEIHVVY